MNGTEKDQTRLTLAAVVRRCWILAGCQARVTFITDAVRPSCQDKSGDGFVAMVIDLYAPR